MSDKPAIRPLVAGNWKMNGLKSALEEALAVRAGAAVQTVRVGARVLVGEFPAPLAQQGFHDLKMLQLLHGKTRQGLHDRIDGRILGHKGLHGCGGFQLAVGVVGDDPAVS